MTLCQMPLKVDIDDIYTCFRGKYVVERSRRSCSVDRQFRRKPNCSETDDTGTWSMISLYVVICSRILDVQLGRKMGQ